MSAILDTDRDARVAALLKAHDGDADAALLACLLHIDRLARLHAAASVQSSYGYTRGRLRPHAGVSADVVTPNQEPLDF